MRPDQRAILSRSELDSDPQVLAGSTYCPFEHFRNIEKRSDGANVLGFSLDRKHRSARRDAQAIHLRKRVDQLIGYSIAQVFVVGIGPRVDERAHRDAA